jgi:hypothetical protein
VSILGSISRYPMMQAPQPPHLPQVQLPTAPSVNPEFAKAAMYGGGGASAPAQGQGAAPAGQGAAPAGQGIVQGDQQSGGIMDAIKAITNGMDISKLIQMLGMAI